ncbi:MAG: hypothetical protein AB1461_12190 [Thermodesulfobacteriota bacterium]
MKESDLRKFHQLLGIAFALFFLLQGGSGLLLALGELFEADEYAPGYSAPRAGEHEEQAGHEEDGEVEEEHGEHGIIGQIHHREATVWHVYRVLVGTALLVQLIAGLAIFARIRARQKRA